MNLEKLNQIKEKRFKFLKMLYEVTGGSEFNMVNMFDIGNELGFERTETDRIVQYLKGEGLIKMMAMGGGIAITHWGVKQVEEAVANPDKPTTYFPPVNMIFVQNMTNSQIQQGTVNSHQTGTFTSDQIGQLKELINEIKHALSNTNLPVETRAEVEAEIISLEAQANSPKPKPSVIKECLLSLRNISDGLTSNLIWSKVQPLIDGLLQSF